MIENFFIRKFTSLGSGFLIAVLWVVTSVYAASASQNSNTTGLSGLVSGFEEPLVRTAPTSSEENEALLHAIESYESRSRVDDFRAFDVFLSSYPDSGWRVAVLTNLGLAYYHYGYFSKAIDAWEEAWKQGRNATAPDAKALVDRAVGELARMHARLGHADRLATLFEEIGERPASGLATEALAGAREGLWMMRNNPGVAYLCGPLALRNLLLFQNADPATVRILDEYRSGPHGVTLAEVGRLAQQLNLPYKLAYRESNQAIPVPSIVHWKVNHFAAVIEEVNGRYHIKDPTFGTDLWVTHKAIESESSGYFLIPSENIKAGFREVSLAEAKDVRGMGFTATNDQSATRPSDETAMSDCTSSGMCVYNVKEMVVSLNLKDTPVGYAPPVGPPVYVSVVYNQREAGQPANLSFFNVSPKWTLSWLSYIQDDPTLPGASVSRYVAGGGYVNYFGYNSSNGFFWPESVTKVDAILRRTSDTAYHRFLPDGAEEIYSLSDGATSFPRRIFLTQIIDPAGNAVTLHYDAQLRLTSITDATGRDTTFSYESTTSPLLVTTITDPFGRSAHIAYDATGRLSQITDVAGLTSQFAYDASSLVTSMTTPYGTTKFAFGTGTGYGPSRFLEVTDPLGNSERVEYLQGAPGIASEESPVPVGITPFNYQGSMFMNGRNTFYWDKHVLAIARGDYTKARIRHWLHDSTDPTGTTTSSVIESVKYPLERRIWRNYPGQYGGGSTGNLDKPSIVARVLDDGSTQSAQFTYNFRGKPLTIIDPVGRETFYDYDSSGYDLVGIRQQTSQSGVAQLGTFTYNNQHLPLTYTDAAGQTTTYAYNTAGQLTRVTNPLNQTTSYVYDGLGQLIQIIDSNNATQASFTYDGFGRVRTDTDVNGFTRTYSYDTLDRVTQISYPDGTSKTFAYTNLDITQSTDRLNRVTRYYYNPIRQLIQVTDPLGRTVGYDYCACGSLISLTDANGNVTQWIRNIENRVTGKVYDDNSGVAYSYDLAGRMTSMTDAKSQTTTYQYNVDNTLASIGYPSPTPSVKFTYDDFRRLSTITDAIGTTTYSYVPAGQLGALQLASEQKPFPYGNLTYGYDQLGHVINRSIDSMPMTWQYDSIGRVTAIANPLGTFSYDYLGASQLLTDLNEPNGQRFEYQYYNAQGSSRLHQIMQNRAGGVGHHVFEYDAVGNITRWHQQNLAPDTAIWDLGYDADNGLTSVNPSGNGPLSGNSNFLYDGAQNLIQLVNTLSSPISYTVNSLNEQLQATSKSVGDSYQMTYDGNGNQTTRVDGSSATASGTRNYQWDAANRLIEIDYLDPQSKNITGSSLLSYDALGRLVRLLEKQGATLQADRRFVWAGNEMIQERDSQGNIVKQFFPQGFKVLIGTAAASPGGYYYGRDHLGSVRNLTGSDGTERAAFDYGPYGEALQSSGDTRSDFGYTGLFYHPRSGLNFALHRAYDPVLKRWLSRDPLADPEVKAGPNVYAYVQDRPLNFIDPTGDAAFGVVFGISAEAGAGVGAGASSSVAAGIFNDPCTGTSSIGVVQSAGAAAVLPESSGGTSTGAPNADTLSSNYPTYFAGLVTPSASGGFFYSPQATSPTDLEGPFDNININLGPLAATISWGTNSAGKPIWVFSASASTGVVSLGVSSYPTYTTQPLVNGNSGSVVR
jgi:RHS repeat-associated protein